MAKSQIRQYIFTPGAAGAGTIKVPGKYDLQQLLVITNATKNTIIYNFADTTYAGTTVTLNRANDPTTFISALDNTDGISTITLAVNTSSMSSTDQLQILYERPDMLVRMPDIGTDAFERTRTSNPLSMLDADFEYGLQPTKWLTYDLMRGYPSIYEVPGTDQVVSTVTTDASAGTGGIGESLITITNSTNFPTSWTVGSPITVKGYLNTVLGFARAEGSFIINSLPGGVGGNTLTYYAKSKVGTNNGDILSSIYTQLRQGAFYTGSSVGTPTYTYVNPTVVATSSSASISTTTTTIVGSITGNALVVTSGTASIGLVLSGGNITTGTYIVSGSGSNWTVSTPQLTATPLGTTITGTQTVLVTAGTITGTWAVGQIVSSATSGVLTGTNIIALGTGTGSNTGGTYYLNYSQSVSSTALSATTASAIVTVTFATNHGFIPGNSVISQISTDNTINNNSLAQGPFYVETVPTLTSITFTARTSGLIFGTLVGVIYARPDSFYQHRPFDGGVMLGTGGPQHGSMSVRMSKKYIRYQSGKSINYNTGALFAPNYDVRSIIATNLNTTTYTTTTVGTIAFGSFTITVASGANILNGQLLTLVGVPTGAYVVSGGGTTVLTINIATVATINAGSTVTLIPGITITTDDTDHGCQVGAQVNLLGVATTGYSGLYTVTAIIDERNLIVPVTTTLGSLNASINSPCTMQIVNWWGATVRAGTFDEQNGAFWQWDGQTMAVGRRSSTFQIAGVVSVVPDSNSIVGTNSRFTQQLISGDRIVIKGMTHVVSQVVSDTQLYITPDYRGSVAVTGVKMVKTIDRLIPQSQWNIDHCDGSNGPFNPSGFQIVVNKMQMVCLQWTWYGAGFIDWMIRGPEGKYITVHRLRGNNLNTEAYMRSGNQPVRYEVSNEGSRSSLSVSAGLSDTVLNLTDVTFFPTPSATYPAYVWADNEIISYTGKTVGTTSQTYTLSSVTSGTLTGCVRSTALPVFASGLTRNFYGGPATAHAAGTGIILIGQTATPSISHWGSAFLQDGGFDADRGYIFNYQGTNIAINTKKTTAFAIRLAPSVSNAITGDLGVRELINRAQLLLQTIEITIGGTTNVNSAVVIEGILNPSNYPSTVTNITWNSLNSTTLPTGQPSFSQIAAGSSVTFNNAITNSVITVIGTPASSNVIPINSSTGILVGDDVFFPGFTNAVYGKTAVSSITNYTWTATMSVATGGTTSTATGTITGTVLTVTTAPTNGGFTIGTVLSGSNVSAGTVITGIITGTSLSANSTYSVSISQTVASTTITATTYTLTVTGFTPVTSPSAVSPGALLSGGSVTAGTYVVAQASATNTATVIGTLTGTIGTNTITISAITLGSLSLITVGQFVQPVTGVPINTFIIAVSLSTSFAVITVSNVLTASGSTSGGLYTAGQNGTYLLNQTYTGTPTGGSSSTAVVSASNVTAPVILAIPSGSAVQFSRNTYAVPGETVFSFISSPSNKDLLDLTPFKELTNTPIGGRGTFPNGPDVLFINVYLTQGAPVLANLVLRWAEAQA